MAAVRNLLAGVVAAVAAALIVGLTIVPAASAVEGSCPNEARRVEQSSTFLPDCRAYELVSLPNSQPSKLTGEYSPYRIGAVTETAAAVNGERLIYSSWFNPPESTAFAHSYVTTRDDSGWTTESPNPPQSTQAHAILCTPWPIGFSQDMSIVVVADGRETEGCGHTEPPIAAGEPEGVRNLYLRENLTGAFSFVNTMPVSGSARNAYYEDANADGSHILFVDSAQLTPEAPVPPSPTERGDLYEWVAGAVHLVSFLPDGEPVDGALANGGTYTSLILESFPGVATITNAMSEDGERVVFYAGVNQALEGGNLYLRLNAGRPQSHVNRAGECSELAMGCTVQVDVSETATPSIGAKFRWATPDGSRVFFTDEGRLTADATAESGKPDLYEYDLEKPKGERLTDLTVDASEPADVLGVSGVGVAEDGSPSYVYFVAHAALTPAGQENANHEHAEAGQPNLYVRYGDVYTFIARLSPLREPESEGFRYRDANDWQELTTGSNRENHFSFFTARVSKNGRFLAFNSQRSLTGYNNNPPSGSNDCANELDVEDAPCAEIYVYDAAHNHLACASCDPSGAPPVGPALILGAEDTMGGGASPIPWGVFQRNLSNDGRVFFNSKDVLAPEDVNGQLNVYEYFEGHQHLISSGTSPAPSYFADASADGSNVFFITSQGLVNKDGDGQESVYDARVDGGFASQNESIVPPACEAIEACRSPLTEPPAQLTSGSAALVGPGNLAVAPERPVTKQPAAKNPAKCKKGFVRSHGKCVKSRHVKHEGKQHKRTVKRPRRAKHATYTHGSAK